MSAPSLQTTNDTEPTPRPAAETIRPSSFRRKAIGISSIAGGLLTFAGFLTTEWEGTTKTLDYLNSLAVDPVRSQIAAILLHFGYLMLVPMFLGLAMMARRRFVVVGNVGLVAGLVGAISLPGELITDFYDLGIRQTLSDQQAVEVSDRVHSYGLANIMHLPMLAGLLIGVILLGLAAWRSGFISWLPPVLFIASFFLGGAPTLLGGAIAGGGMLVLMAWVGIRVLRISDDEWRTGLPAGK